MKIQVTLADQHGLDVHNLIHVLEQHYRTPEGKRVRVKIGQGEFIDGLPEGYLRLVDAE